MSKHTGLDSAGLTAEVARTPRGKPLRAAITVLVAVALAAAGAAYQRGWFTLGVKSGTKYAILAGGAILFAIFAMVAVISFARLARWYLEPHIGADYASVTRYAVILIGTLLVAVAAFTLAGVFIWQLVLPGAVTIVVITIAAQQALANLFAGVMLQFARPFSVGERVQIRSGGLAGTIEGTVVELSLAYVRLATDAGLVFVPNAQVLAAAVGPVAPPSRDLPLTPDSADEDQPQRLGEPEGVAADHAVPGSEGAGPSATRPEMPAAGTARSAS